MSNKIDVGRLIASFGFKRGEIASLLFPDNKHPLHALDRVQYQEALLDELQIQKIIDLTGLKYEELVSNNWKANADQEYITLERGEFVAVLNKSTWTTKLYQRGQLQDTIILQNPLVTLSEYVLFLDNLISKSKCK